MKICNSGLPLPLVQYCKRGTLNGSGLECHCQNDCSRCVVIGNIAMHPELHGSPIISAEAQTVMTAVHKDTGKLSAEAGERMADNRGVKTIKSKKKTLLKRKLRAGPPKAKHA